MAWEPSTGSAYGRSEVCSGKTPSVNVGQLRLPPGPIPSHPPSLNILAEESRTRSPASPHDGCPMIPRTLSSVAKRVTSTVPVRKQDVSTSPRVGAKARTVLSRLPIPPLRSTLDKYLQSIKPLLLQDDLQGVSVYEPAYQRRVEWAKEFETGIGATLQARLIGMHYLLMTAISTVSAHTQSFVALDKSSPHNWLDDNFWLYKAYLEWRAPLLINSNWWLLFQDEAEIPESARDGLSETVIGLSPWQIRRSASLVYHALAYKDVTSEYVCLFKFTSCVRSLPEVSMV